MVTWLRQESPSFDVLHLDRTMVGFVGGPPESCKTWLFADSDHAGEHDNRSTSGCLLALVGPNTFYPLTAFSKKQTSTAMSSTEAEVTAANLALRAVGLPSSCLWSACSTTSPVEPKNESWMHPTELMFTASVDCRTSCRVNWSALSGFALLPNLATPRWKTKGLHKGRPWLSGSGLGCCWSFIMWSLNSIPY